MPTEIPGRCLGYSDTRSSFVYAYECIACGRTFQDTAPTVLPPVVCHGCFSGAGRPSRRNSRRGAAHAMPSGRRKNLKPDHHE